MKPTVSILLLGLLLLATPAAADCTPPNCWLSFCWLSKDTQFFYDCGWVWAGASRSYVNVCDSNRDVAVFSGDGDRVYQDVEIPNNYSGFELQIALSIDTSSETFYDRLVLEILDPSTDTVLETVTHIATVGSSYYQCQPLGYSVNDYSGQTIRISARAIMTSGASVTFTVTTFGIYGW
jgi:hypothetical protein